MRKWIPLLLTLGGFVLSLGVYGQLPTSVAPNLEELLPFARRGETDLVSRPAAAFGLPAIAFLVWVFLHEAPVSRLGRAAGGLFPSRNVTALSLADYEKFAPSYRLIVIWVVGLVLSVHVAVLAAGLSWRVEPGLIVGLVFGAGLLTVGNVMPRLRPNAVAGIRTARTMQDPQIWARVHRRYGAYWLVSGVIVLAVAILAPRYALTAGAATLLITSLATLAGSSTIMLGLACVAGLID